MGLTHWEWGSNANAGVTEVFMEPKARHTHRLKDDRGLSAAAGVREPRRLSLEVR